MIRCTVRAEKVTRNLPYSCRMPDRRYYGGMTFQPFATWLSQRWQAVAAWFSAATGHPPPAHFPHFDATLNGSIASLDEWRELERIYRMSWEKLEAYYEDLRVRCVLNRALLADRWVQLRLKAIIWQQHRLKQSGHTPSQRVSLLDLWWAWQEAGAVLDARDFFRRERERKS